MGQAELLAGSWAAASRASVGLTEILSPHPSPHSCLLAQVLNQTSRMESQLLKTSLSTNKLEKQLLLQSRELHQLQGHNR